MAHSSILPRKNCKLQKNPIPDCQTILNFVAARDNGGRVGMIYIIDIYHWYISDIYPIFSTKKSKISMHEKIEKIDTNIDQTINEKVLRIL